VTLQDGRYFTGPFFYEDCDKQEHSCSYEHPIPLSDANLEIGDEGKFEGESGCFSFTRIKDGRVIKGSKTKGKYTVMKMLPVPAALPITSDSLDSVFNEEEKQKALLYRRKYDEFLNSDSV
jgi:hypothetical protein